VRRFRLSTLMALILAIGLSLVGSTTYARYLSTIGPAECCRSHCHRGVPDTDADRCCTVHLSVLPAALGPTAPDVQHALGAFVAWMPAPAPSLLADPATTPARIVTLRGSPPSTLVAVHAALLI
jgi:hypothetical protein